MIGGRLKPMSREIADMNIIRKILDQTTAKQLSEATNISLSTIKKLKSGERSIEKMNLADAIKLTQYGVSHLSAEIIVWKS